MQQNWDVKELLEQSAKLCAKARLISEEYENTRAIVNCRLTESRSCLKAVEKGQGTLPAEASSEVMDGLPLNAPEMED